MPKKTVVELDFFDKPKSKPDELFECLKDLATAWTFLPGEDFKGQGRNFQHRVKNWASRNDLVVKCKADSKGGIVIQAFEMTDEDRARREKNRARLLLARAAREVTAENSIPVDHF